MSNTSIPKIIHYCWIGGNPKPASVLHCIESWKKYCPDYEIREWNETNYDFTTNLYMKQAYDAKKWGFVPDYARLDIVYKYGGIYLDTDVEVKKSFDNLLHNSCFFGFENTGDGEYFINCGHGFGAIPKHNAIKYCRDLYNDLEFYKDDGELNLIPSPYYTTISLKKFGLIQEDKDQMLEQIQIYASDVLCPKNFRTGKIKKTSRTISIHHFTASWLDEKIKSNLKHQQKINKFFGKKLGHYILYLESVYKKYSIFELLKILLIKICAKLKKKSIIFKDNINIYLELLKTKLKIKPQEKYAILDTSIDSDNMGDYIIMENCILHLPECFKDENIPHIPTHRNILKTEENKLKKAGTIILCGTNILSNKMRNYGLWKMSNNISIYKNTILMGVGFDSYNSQSDLYTKLLFKSILNKKGMHSVRDSFSENALKTMGIKNVINTGCPTMWCLNEDHCNAIPKTKAKNVICTLTDYNHDEKNDKKMLDILIKNYYKVFFWLQGQQDLDYIKSLGYFEKVIIIESNINAFDEILHQDDLDYVGTRLHAGIRALSTGHRSLIVAIDNRAECIHNDTDLPIIKRSAISESLETILNNEIVTNIRLPWKNITIWKNQFRNDR